MWLVLKYQLSTCLLPFSRIQMYCIIFVIEKNKIYYVARKISFLPSFPTTLAHCCILYSLKLLWDVD